MDGLVDGGEDIDGARVAESREVDVGLDDAVRLVDVVERARGREDEAVGPVAVDGAVAGEVGARGEVVTAGEGVVGAVGVGEAREERAWVGRERVEEEAVAEEEEELRGVSQYELQMDGEGGVT